MSKAAKATIGLMIATMIAKVLGFGRELVLASTYGDGMYTEAYLMAMSIPIIIFSMIGNTLSTVLIPTYFQVENERGEEESLKFINNTFNIVVVICAILATLGIVFVEPLVNVFAPGFTGEKLILTINFSKVMIISLVFTGLSYLMASYLQIKNNFVIPGLISVPRNIITIVAIIISSKFDPYMMIWGTLLGIMVEFLFQYPYAVKAGYKYKFVFNIKDEYIKKMAWLILPVLIGVSVNQVNQMIDRSIATTLVEGSVAALNFANKLNLFVTVMFINTISAVIYPMMSKLSNESNKDKFIEVIPTVVNTITLLIIPISVGAMVLATPIVRLLFERGEFTSEATQATAIALFMYSPGMIGYGLRDILGKVFYSLQDTKTPMKNGVIAVVINIVLNFILAELLGFAGLALATSISAIVCIFLLFNSLNKRIGYYGQDKIIKTTIKSMISATIMGIATYFGYDLLSGMLSNDFIGQVISLFGSILIGVIVYAVVITISRVDEINSAIDMIKNNIKKKKAS